MSRQLHTLFILNTQLQDLDMAQDMINSARKAWPYSQRIQLELDREQNELDSKRRVILMAQYIIASSN